MEIFPHTKILHKNLICLTLSLNKKLIRNFRKKVNSNATSKQHALKHSKNRWFYDP